MTVTWRDPGSGRRVAFIALMLLWLVYLQQAGIVLVNDDDAIAYAYHYGTLLGVAGLWVLGWSWLTGSRQGRHHLAEHLGLGAAFLAINDAILGWLIPWLFFIVGWPWHVYFYWALLAVLLAAIALAHLRIAYARLSGALLLVWALVSLCGAFWLATYIGFQRANAPWILPYYANLYDPRLMIRPAGDLDSTLKDLWRGDWSATGKTGQESARTVSKSEHPPTPLVPPGLRDQHEQDQ
ncbi:MAG: hypothetical protein ACOZB0_08680 [Pseudomonadota bacterium]